jgi:GNAT superfamily N-acetyltransferase
MDGPINFGETDKFWGLLVEGFTQPCYQVAYNPPYYKKLFENYGFRTYYEQEGFILDLNKGIPDRFWKIAEWVTKKPNIHFEHFDWKRMEKHVQDFTKVFNEAWQDFKENFEPLEPDYVRDFLKKGKMVLEEKMIWFAYHEDEPIAIFLMYPDLNQLFKPLNGRLHLLNKLRLLFRLKTMKMTRARGVLMGVVPSFQGRGMESGFIYHVEKVLREEMPQYEELEFSWVGDFNPPMRQLWEKVGAEPAKRYITYRYLFDRERPFERYPLPDDA